MWDWPEDLSDLQLPKGADPERRRTVAARVGQILDGGSLALFIGTGISKVVDLPMWRELNGRIIQEAAALLEKEYSGCWNSRLAEELPSLEELGKTQDCLGLLDRVEQVCSRCESLVETGAADPDRFVGNGRSWRQVVRRALYGDRTVFEFEEMFHPELVSLCGLMTGGRRGVVREIVTFNYDDLLQSFLRLQGHAFHVVTPLPNQLTPNHCTVFYHPHGYLPLEGNSAQEAPFVVLSRRSYDRMLVGGGQHARLWRDLIRWMLTVRIGLFVGTSGNDDIFKLYFDEAIQYQEVTPSRRPLAFALLVGEGYLAPEGWLRRRVVPLEFSDEKDVAKFLCMVCQEAGRRASFA